MPSVTQESCRKHARCCIACRIRAEMDRAIRQLGTVRLIVTDGIRTWLFFRVLAGQRRGLTYLSRDPLRLRTHGTAVRTTLELPNGRTLTIEFHLPWATPSRTKDRTMLVLSRKKDEKIIIGDNVAIMVVDIQGDKVRLGIEAPRDVTVHREEVYAAIQKKQSEPVVANP